MAPPVMTTAPRRLGLGCFTGASWVESEIAVYNCSRILGLSAFGNGRITGTGKVPAT
jgi:hypothetical protein